MKPIILGEILSEAIKAESFKYVRYESSIITSKIQSKTLSNENKKTGVFRKIAC